MTTRSQHPSGRPIRRLVTKGQPIFRIPDTQPNVPRLRQDAKTVAIGFVHRFDHDEEQDD